MAVGSKQHTYGGCEKLDGLLSTVITDSIFLTRSLLPTKVEPCKLSVYLGNTFIQANNDKRILMLLHGKVTELMVRFNRDLNRPYINYSKKRVPILYVRLSKALYRMLKAALLF